MGESGGVVVRSKVPGEFEQLVLLTLAGFDADASGREVYEVVTSATGRDVAIAAVHITLDRIEQKGWASSETREPEPGEGGRPRRRYAISAAGIEMVRELRRQHDALWGRASTNPLLDGGAR